MELFILGFETNRKYSQNTIHKTVHNNTVRTVANHHILMKKVLPPLEDWELERSEVWTLESSEIWTLERLEIWALERRRQEYGSLPTPIHPRHGEGARGGVQR